LEGQAKPPDFGIGRLLCVFVFASLLPKTGAHFSARCGKGLLPFENYVIHFLTLEEKRIMAKGQVKSNKEIRKPKKDAGKKPAAAAKAAPAAKPKSK